MESRRKAEIEAKKQKLAELKKARLERQATLAAAAAAAAGADSSKSGRSTPALDRERPPSTRAQLDELVSSLLGGGGGGGGTTPTSIGSASVAGTASPRLTRSDLEGGRLGLSGTQHRPDPTRSVWGRTSVLSTSTTTSTSAAGAGSGAGPVDGEGELQGSAITVTTGAVAAGSVSSEASSLTPAVPPGATLASEPPSSSFPAIPPPVPFPTPPPPSAPARPKVTTYDKAIQTVPVEPRSRKSSRNAGVGGERLDGADKADDDDDDDGTRTRAAAEAEIRARILKEIEMQKEIERLEAEEKAREEERQRDQSLSSTDLDEIYSSSEFQNFLDHSSKILERALNDNYDYLRDYTIGDGDASLGDQGKRVKQVCAFYDERWCRNRSVTSLEWSPKFPELSVAAYNKNALSLSDPDGIACIWNLHLVDRPEFVFHSQSDILSVAFSPFHPNLLIGGTYAGQILIWDTRAKSLPVLKSPLSAAGHTHPVYSLAMVGTQNAHNLISASTDGTVCSWTLDMLAKPQETLELTQPQHPKTDEVSVTSIAFQGNETTTLLVGTEEGNIYAANRYDRAGAKAGLLPGEIYRAHSGPVLGVDYHPLAGPIDFSDLFLSCGVDWTVRLWRSKNPNAPSSAAATASGGRGPSSTGRTSRDHQYGGGSTLPTASGIAPLYTFEENTDYVLDARWHPAHPALFGTVDASGKFDIWNLNAETEVPYVSTMVGEAAHGSESIPISSLSSEAPRRGLNKLAWDKRDGRHAAIGSSDGKVYVYDIGGMATPRETEWEVLRRTITSLTNHDSVVGR